MCQLGSLKADRDAVGEQGAYWCECKGTTDLARSVGAMWQALQAQ